MNIVEGPKLINIIFMRGVCKTCFCLESLPVEFWLLQSLLEIKGSEVSSSHCCLNSFSLPALNGISLLTWLFTGDALFRPGNGGLAFVAKPLVACGSRGLSSVCHGANPASPMAPLSPLPVFYLTTGGTACDLCSIGWNPYPALRPNQSLLQC